MVKKADSQLIKKFNEVRLLNLTREYGPISRIELAKRSRISKVAVSEIISRLSEAGFILEVGKGESSLKGGKRPTLIKLNPDNGYVVAIEVKRQQSRIAVANLESTILDQDHISYPPQTAPDRVIPQLIEAVTAMLNRRGLNRAKLVSLCLALPGFVDYERGRLHFADTLKGWTGYPVAARFQEAFGVPVILENDVKASTYGESQIGAGRGVENLIGLWIGEGIGAGIVINGKLFRGTSGRAGEVGYLKIGQLCDDHLRFEFMRGDHQFFGEMLSEGALLDGIRRSYRAGGIAEGPESLDAALDSYNPHAERVRPVLREFGTLLGVICSYLIKAIDPGMIVLNGRLIEDTPLVLETVTRTITERMADIPFGAVAVVPGHLRGNAPIKGAVALALQTVFGLPVTANGSAAQP